MRRDEIVQAAATVFAHKGYAEATLGDVADRLNIHTAGLYYYYENKDAVVEAVLRYAATRIKERTDEALEGTEHLPAIDRLRIFVKAYLGVAGRRDDVGLAFWKIYDQVSPQLRKVVAGRAKQNFGTWRGLVEAAVAEGTVRSDVPVGILRNLLMGGMMWTPEWYRANGTHSLEEIAEALLRLLMAPAPEGPAAKPARRTARK